MRSQMCIYTTALNEIESIMIEDQKYIFYKNIDTTVSPSAAFPKAIRTLSAYYIVPPVDNDTTVFISESFEESI